MNKDLIRIIADFPKPGIIFKDITPLLADAKAFKDCCEKIAEFAKDVDYIAGVEARGFILASAVALLSGKGFIPIRKSGKLPGQVFSQSYELEYGQATLEIHSDLVPAGKKVLIVDDVLAVRAGDGGHLLLLDSSRVSGAVVVPVGCILH